MRISIFTEGGKGKGLGHLSRCKALAQALRVSLPAVDIHLMAEIDRQTLSFLESSGIRFRDLDWVHDTGAAVDMARASDAIIVDSYHAPKKLYSMLCEAVSGKMICLDDYARISYPGGTVLNPSVYGGELDYSGAEGTTYLLGAEYIVLRKAFWNVPEKTVRENIHVILVLLKEELCRKVVPWIREYMQDESVKIVIPAFQKCVLNGKNLRDQIMEADLCISAGGVTLYELARCGTPAIGIKVAENQSWNLRELEKNGVVRSAGAVDTPHIQSDILKALGMFKEREERKRCSSAGRALVDGKGALRIAGYITDSFFATPDKGERSWGRANCL